MDGPQFRVAARIRSLRRERFQCRCRGSLYPDAGSASPKDDLRTGIHRLARETRRCIRSAIRIRLKILCRASGAVLLFVTVTHGDAVGYPVVAPDGARGWCNKPRTGPAPSSP